MWIGVIIYFRNVPLYNRVRVTVGSEDGLLNVEC